MSDAQDTQDEPIEVSRSDGDTHVNVQYQVTQQGKEEIAASFQRIREYEDGQQSLGVPLSLFIKDTDTARLLYEALQVHYEEGRI